MESRRQIHEAVAKNAARQYAMQLRAERLARESEAELARLFYLDVDAYENRDKS